MMKWRVPNAARAELCSKSWHTVAAANEWARAVASLRTAAESGFGLSPLVGDRVNAEAQRAMLLKNGERELELTLDLRQRASGHSGVQFCIDCNTEGREQLIMRTASRERRFDDDDFDVDALRGVPLMFSVQLNRNISLRHSCGSLSPSYKIQSKRDGCMGGQLAMPSHPHQVGLGRTW